MGTNLDPLPWARKLRLDDVFLAQGDVDQVPRDVHERGVRLLDAVNTIRRDNESVIHDLGEATAILAEPSDRGDSIGDRDMSTIGYERLLSD